MSHFPPDSQPLASGRPSAPDDQLPPVEPPSATFILQLFVVPAVIVVAIVMLWMLFSWVANKGEDPQKYFAALQRPGPGRWQMASNLATALRDQRHDDFKRDRVSAQRLAQILDAEIDAASKPDQDSNALILREFLCKALGEFYVDDGLEVLLKAATTQRGAAEVSVRRSAVESIALLAENVRQESPAATLAHPDLHATLRRLARDDDDLVRVRVAFALGVMRDEALTSLLAEMLRDASVDVRYNAALALARLGDVRSIAVLEQMLDPDQDEALELEKDESMRAHKRATILNNALRAARMLAAENREADLGELAAAVERLAAADTAPAIKTAAAEILKQLRR